MSQNSDYENGISCAAIFSLINIVQLWWLVLVILMALEERLPGFRESMILVIKNTFK